MNAQSLFIDTNFFFALLNKNDAFHEKADALVPLLKSAKEVVLHEGILVELANAMCQNERDRSLAVQMIRESYNTDNTKVINISSDLMRDGIKFYSERPDKEWSLTDCISFLVMNENSLSEALTSDHHFEQAGFVKLL